MALFRRSSGPDPQDGSPADARAREQVEAFWGWWRAEGRSAAEQEAGALGLGERLAPLGLTGEVVTEGHLDPATGSPLPGRTLLVGGGTDRAARAAARRLLLGAPGDDGWTYLDHRPAVAAPEEVVLFSDGELVDLDRVRVSARLRGDRLDVAVHHPAYPQLGTESRQGLSVQALDAALGELGTELWVGEITAAATPPVDAFGLGALRAVVADLERQHVDADGTPRWVELHGQGPGGPLVALVRRLLVPATAPHLDTYVSVTLPYRGRDAQGLPDDASVAALESFGQDLARTLGHDGEVVAHLSTGGTRTLHVYADSTAGAVDRVRRAARDWSGGRATVHSMLDPDWDAVAHLRH